MIKSVAEPPKEARIYAKISGMDEAALTWRERKPRSPFIESVWSCHVSAETLRTVIADPCNSIALVKGGTRARVVLAGAKTTSSSMLLAAGYSCTVIRLKPGVFFRDFPASELVNTSLAIAVDARSRFWLGGKHLTFPDFEAAELFIKQLQNAGIIVREVLRGPGRTRSPRTYARFIKQTTGLSPHQLYQLQRMHQVLRLLKDGKSAADVAAELAFTDQSHLVHTSKRFFGRTPKLVRGLPQRP